MTIASGTWTNGDLGSGTWRIEDDGTMYVEGTGKMNDYNSEYNLPWASNRTAITNVIVGEGITYIGSNSFHAKYQDTQLISVVLPSTLTSIGGNAFYSCEKLESINLSHIESISGSAFGGCKSLTSLRLDRIKTIGYEAFLQCTGLTTVILGDVESIGTCVFDQCTSLRSLHINSIQDDLSSIKPIFENTRNPYVFETLTFGSEKSSVIPQSMFNRCTQLRSVDLGGVTTIGKNAFSYCSSLKSIDLKNVTSAGEYAFQFCTSLETVNLRGLTSIPPYFFYDCSSLKHIDLKNVKNVSNMAFWDCISLRGVTFSENLTYIGERAFCGCDNCGYYRFMGAKPTFGSNAIGIRHFTSGNSVYYEPLNYIICITDLGWGNSNVVGQSNWIYNFDTAIGDDITWSVDENMVLKLVGKGATYDYEVSGSNVPPFRFIKVSDIIICEGITTLGSYLFDAVCSNLRSIHLPESLTAIKNGVFSGNLFEALIIPSKVTTFGGIEINSYNRQHYVLIFRGLVPENIKADSSGYYTLHIFSPCHIENDTTKGINATYPIMIKIKDGWKVIDSSRMIDNT